MNQEAIARLHDDVLDRVPPRASLRLTLKILNFAI